MMQQKTFKVNNGDFVHLITYNLTPIGDKAEPKIRVSRDVQAFKAGPTTFSVTTRIGDRRFRHDQINVPTEGIMRNSYIIIATDEEDVQKAIELAKEAINNRLNRNINRYKELIADHESQIGKSINATELSREHQ